MSLSSNLHLGTTARSYATNTNPSVVGVNDNNLVYSVRKVVPTYTGYACRIRRSSDDAEADISFDSSNKISLSSVATLVADGSTSTLGTFTSGTDAFVDIWYNQCKNTNDVVIGDTGTIRSLKTNNKLSLSGDFTITLTINCNFLGASGNGLKMWIMHGLESNGTTGDGIAIENNAIGRGGYLKCYINGSTITASGGRLTDTSTQTFVVSRSSGTVTFSRNGVSQGTVSNSDAISVTANTYLGGNQDASHTLTGSTPFTISAFTVVDGSTTVYDIKDGYLFDAEIGAANFQPKLIDNGSLINTSNGDVSLEFDGSDDYISPANFINRLADTSSGFLAYAEADSTSVGSGEVDPILSQYQESSGTPAEGAFYLGASENGWTTLLQSSSDGVSINAGGTSTLTRSTILGLGKPNSSSGTATFFRADATDGLYSEVNDTFNQSINTFYTGIGHANGSEYFDGHIVEVIVLNGGSADETRRAFNEQRNYWGI
tara:strand:- start:893 stop:2356 length:1464 start_codon:yes stop_codon:yes gene_type:complete